MKKRVWKFGKRLLCGALALVLAGGVLAEPAAAAAAGRWTPTPLESSRLEDVPEGNYLYFGTASVTLDEADAAYSVVIYREGDLSGEATVEVRTIDLSATYGKDYSLLMPAVEKSGNGQTILEQYMEAVNDLNEDASEPAESEPAESEPAESEPAESEPAESEPAESEPAESEPAESEPAESEPAESEPAESEPAESEPTESEPAESEPAESEPAESEPAESEPTESEPAESKPAQSEPQDYVEVEGTGAGSSEETGKSSLALLKENQTGEETRDLYETEYEDMLDSMVQQFLPEVMDQIDYSSSTTLTFAPGESEKTLVFRIKDDSKSEGTETFSIRLTNGVGAAVYQVDTLSVTINDDEPTVHSKVSFAKSSYVAENGQAVVTIKRTGAEYSLVDMQLVSSGDTATAGVNYEEINETIAFAPYEKEKTLTIPVCGEGKFSLLLTDMTACEAGKYTETVIDIIPTEGDTGGFATYSSAQQPHFPITINGKSYTVYYNTGDYTGKIMDEQYEPALEVGTYYFALPTTKGGIFHYGTEGDNFEGSKPGSAGTLTCEYREPSGYAQHDCYGCVEYCHPIFWKEGSIWTYSDVVIPAAYYQYAAIDWAGTSDSGNNLRFYFKSPTLGASVKIDQNSGFDRTQNNAHITLLDGNKAYNKLIDFNVTAADETGNCPKSYINFYGVACMYQKYNIKLGNRNQLSFLYGTEGGVKSEYPVSVELKCGAQIINQQNDVTRAIYANTDSTDTNLVLSIEPSTVNNVIGKYGKLTGYTFTIDPGDADQKVTVNYPEDFISYLNNSKGKTGTIADYSTSAVNARIAKVNDTETSLAVIPYDIYFMDWISSVQKGVQTDGYGYCQNLTITPKFDYIDCTVQVLAPEDGVEGCFLYNKIAKPGTYTFHVGDVLDLTVTSNGSNDFTPMGYAVSTDGGVNWDYINSTNTLLLENKGPYLIRPVLSEVHNCIEIVFESGGASNLNVYGVSYQGFIDKKMLVGTDMEGCNILALSNDRDVAKMCTPTVGETYTINIAPYTTAVGLTYYPVITDSDGNVAVTLSFHYTARQRREDNVLYVSWMRAEGGLADESATFTIKGRLVTEYDPILATGTETPKYGAANLLVTTGKGTVTDDTVDTVNARTDEDGYFVLEGIRAYTTGDTTIMVSSGISSQVLRAELDWDNDGDVGEVDLGEIVLSYPTTAPSVRSLTYKYDKTTSDLETNTTSTSIQIRDDNFHITAVVDKKTLNVTKAAFTIRSASGLTSSPVEVTDTADQPGVFTYTIKKMSSNLHNGDRVLVSIAVEENGVELWYPAVDSGLVFYTMNTIKAEQYYETEEVHVSDVPIISAIDAKSSSGVLNFSRTNWSDGTGYTITINMDALWSNKGTPSVAEKQQMSQNLVQKAYEANEYKETAKDFGTKIADLKNTSFGLAMGIGAVGADTTSMFEEMWDIKKQIEAFEPIVDKAKNEYAEAKNAVANYGKGQIMQVDILFLMAFDFVLDPAKGEYVFCSGAVSAGGSVNYNKTFYFIIQGAPVFINLLGFAQGDLTAYYATPDGKAALTAGDFEDYSGNITARLGGNTYFADVIVGCKVSIGVGMCNVVGAGGTATLQVKARIPLSSASKSGFGAMLVGSGSLFFDLFVMRIDIPLVTGTLGFGIYEGQSSVTYLGAFNSLLSTSLSEEGTYSSGGQGVSISDFGAGTSDFSSFGGNGFVRATPEEVSRTVLLDNAAERTAPQIVDLGNGKKMIFFIGNRGYGDSLSCRALYYSVYSDGTWSEPQMVDNDSTFDGKPAVLAKNGKVIVAWVDANGSANGSSGPVAKLNSLGISARVYDSTTGTWGNKITLVNDQYFNFAPQLNLVGDTLYVSYMKRELGEEVTDVAALLDYTNSYSTMAYIACDVTTGTIITTDTTTGRKINNPVNPGEVLIPIEHQTLTDPLVLDYHCVTTQVGGENYMLATYTVDENGNLSSSSDRELYLSITNLTTGKTYYPIRLTNDDLNQANPKLTELDGIVYLTWLEEGSEFSLLNVTSLVEGFFHAGDTVDETLKTKYASVSQVYRNATGAAWYRKTAAELGLDESEYNKTGYENAYKGVFQPDSVAIEIPSGAETSISEYELVSNGDDVYIFFTNYDSIDPNDFSQELFGLTYQRDMNANDGVSEPWGFGKVVQITNYGKAIDEFDIIMNAQDKISVVSNYFDQGIDNNGYSYRGENQLVEIEFEPVGSLAIKNDKVDLPGTLVGGNIETVKFTAVNNGLMPAKGFTVTLAEEKGGTTTTVGTWNYDVTIGSGASYDVEIPWTIPADLSDTYLHVTITEKNVEGNKSYTVEKEVPCCSSVTFSNTEASLKDGKAYVTTTVSNKGSVASTACTVQVTARESGAVLGTYAVSSLASGASKNVTIPLDIAVDDFNTVGVLMLDIAALEGTEKVASDAARLVPGKPIVAEINGGAESVSLSSGQTTTLTTKVGPWAEVAGTVSYTSSDPSVASVTKDGVVKGQSSGTATITVYYASGVSGTIQVNVSGSGTVTPVAPSTPQTNTVEKTENGSVSISTETVRVGETVTITATPEEGYKVSTVKVTDANGNTVEVADNGDGTYSFKQPAGGVTVKVTFTKKTKIVFTDVPADAFYADAVDWAVANNITNGNGVDMFYPNENCTRAQIVTFLWRAAGCPEAKGASTFTDVAAEAYYAEAVAWAVENGITDGIGGKFAPDLICTREQAVTFLYRAAGAPAVTTASQFSDVPAGAYYTDAVAWAVENNITDGIGGGKFAPKKECTRSEIVTFLFRAQKK